MKKWNTIVLETANKISFSKQPRGISSLYKTLTSSQTDKLIEKLEDYRDKEVSKFLEELETSDDYTRTIAVRFNNVMFGLYGRDGLARIASGEMYSSKKILDEYLDIDEFIKAL